MSIENSFRTYILADPTISALISTRLYTRELPQRPTLPAMTYERDYTLDNYHTTGSSGLVSIGFILRCWDDTTLDSRLLANALRLRISGYQGVMATDYVYSVFRENDSDHYDSDLKKPYVETEYMLWYREIVSGEFEFYTEDSDLLLSETGEQFFATH